MPELDRRRYDVEILGRLSALERSFDNHERTDTTAHGEIAELRSNQTRLGERIVALETESKTYDRDISTLTRSAENFEKTVNKAIGEFKTALDEYRGARRILLVFSHIISLAIGIAASFFSGVWTSHH